MKIISFVHLYTKHLTKINIKIEVLEPRDLTRDNTIRF